MKKMSKQQITHRQRVLAAIEHNHNDVLPVGFKASDDVLRQMQKRFGVADVKGIVSSLPVDTYGAFNNCLYGVYPKYVGGPERVLYPNCYPDGTWDTFYGYKRRWVKCLGGHNDEVINHPLAQAQTIEDMKEHDWPQADWFDYSTISQQCSEVDDYAIIFLVGGLGHAENLVGIERSLTEMALNPKLMEFCFGTLGEFFEEFTKRTLETAKGRIDIVCIQDDFGTQQGNLISLDMYRKFFKPYHKKIFESAKQCGAKVMMHSCGAIFEFIPDFIEIGVDLLDPVQTVAAGMDPKRLKRQFGKDLCFHGGIDVQNTLARGTPKDVRDHIDSLVENLGKDGGFIIAPSHYIHGDARWENIMTIFDQVKRYR